MNKNKLMYERIPNHNYKVGDYKYRFYDYDKKVLNRPIETYLFQLWKVVEIIDRSEYSEVWWELVKIGSPLDVYKARHQEQNKTNTKTNNFLQPVINGYLVCRDEWEAF